MGEKTDEFMDALITGSYSENKDFSDYLKKAGSNGVEQLLKEPHRLNEDRSRLQKQTQELAFSNYKTFIQTADCSRQLFNQFNETEAKVDSILSRLPNLKSQCQNLSKMSDEVNEKKKQNGKIAAKTNELLDLLELPQLMDTCISRGQFEEALALFSYIRRLGKKHGHIPLINSVVNELEGSWRGMVRQLVNQLRSDLPLPKCLQIMGFLRRMEVYNDAELGLKFLQTRDSWLKSLLSSTTVNPGESMSLKKLEIMRVHLFNILTQHRAMFTDEESTLASADTINEPSIFYTWLSEQISQILSLVEDGANAKQAENLEALLGQTMYFGLSFSRVGADFRGPAALRIQQAALAAAESGFKRAYRKFEQDMGRFVLPPGSAVYMPPPATTTDGPPLLLLEFPPLAELTNNILKVFNDTRTCAPLSVAHYFVVALRDCLQNCTKIIVNFYRQEQSALGPGEKATFARFVVAYQILLGYLSKCVGLLYPITELALHLGLPVHYVQSLDLFNLNEDGIIEPLSSFVPRIDVVSGV